LFILIPTEFGVTIKKTSLIKMFLTETYSTVRIEKNLSIRNDFKQGNYLSPLIFNFVLECAIRRVQVKQKG
jgi:hypothetical protein